MLKQLTSALFTFKGLYVAFVIAIVFYGQMRLMFGLTPRHIAILLMLIVCYRKDGAFLAGRYMKAYLVFFLSFVLSATLTGYLSQVLVVNYLSCYVGFWATKILAKRYQSGSLLLNLIVVLGVIDAVATISQSFYPIIAERMLSFLHLNLPEQYLEKLEKANGDDEGLMFVRPGIMFATVYNGYFLMTAGVASLVLLIRKFRIEKLIPWVVITFGSICVQERGPIIILAVLSAFSFYKIFRMKMNRYAFFLMLFGFAVYYLTDAISSVTIGAMNNDDVRRKRMIVIDDESGLDYTVFVKESRFGELGLDDTGRSDIYETTFDYLMDHPFIGGYHRLLSIHEDAPHNLFLNAFIYGGIVGGGAIMLILFWQIKPLWRVLSKRIERTNPVCFFAGLAYVAFTLNSLLHNRSIVTGEALVWILWALFYYEHRKYYRR